MKYLWFNILLLSFPTSSSPGSEEKELWEQHTITLKPKTESRVLANKAPPLLWGCRVVGTGYTPQLIPTSWALDLSPTLRS